MVTTSDVSCFFCGAKVENFDRNSHSLRYTCKRCGPINLREDAVDDLRLQVFKEDQKQIIRVELRNASFKRGNKPSLDPLSMNDLEKLIHLYRPLDPLDKMDHALLTIDRLSKKAGEKIKIPVQYDAFLYHCSGQSELLTILTYLVEHGYIKAHDPQNPHNELWITSNGYQRLRELKQTYRESRICFVAMWFSPAMQKVYDKAVKPAIEFVEEGQTESRFKAIKIDNVEHINDINDEIIATIRRSRFMVCDLTGYRGGVYFEAGFAYGLGLPVIYTCRKDWSSEHKLKDEQGKVVETLKDSSGKDIRVKKEGVHFDLAHRNRIEWEEDKLDEFRVALENRIKAVIV
jgi:nucleoside 2-deoxyribosyltransferase